jgi:hypothetical protein
MIKAVSASETLVNIYQTALHSIPEDRHLHRPVQNNDTSLTIKIVNEKTQIPLI